MNAEKATEDTYKPSDKVLRYHYDTTVPNFSLNCRGIDYSVVEINTALGFVTRMGGWMTHLLWGGDPDAVNPVSGLSKRDIYVVQKTWAVAATDSFGTGTELLKRYFRAYPETKDFFRMIKNVPEEKFTENVQFKAHVINLMSALDLAVRNLHQPEVVAAMMAKLGESHGRRKIQEQHFHDLTIVIVQMFKDVLKLDDKMIAAWGRTVEFWYKHIFETLSSGDNR